MEINLKVKCLSQNYITKTAPCFFKPDKDFKDMDEIISFSTFTSTEEGTEYSIIVGVEYIVYGIMVHDNVMYYLISFEENQPPDWIPSCLFEVSENSIPYFWEFKTSVANNDEVMFIMSHSEIINNFNHMLGLIQGYSSDFEKFKCIMNEYY